MKSMKFALRLAFIAPVLLGLAGCINLFGSAEDTVPPAERQLPASTQALLALKGIREDAPIFIRIFKEESELEVWKLKGNRFELFKTYSICAWSGALGPKVQQGDHQAPEGFYTVRRGQMNPHSLYHLAFNVGFPNAYDRANGHTGSALMVHGNCKSAGCYAMTDAYIEEIYILAREAFNAGQTYFHVHAFPFRMTRENMQRHRDSPWYGFWVKLKEGYDSFEATGKPPIVKVCSKEYMVNVRFPGLAGDPAPDAACPLYAKVDPMHTPGFDGVPPTLVASLNKPQTPAPAAGSPAAPVVAQQQPARPVTPVALAAVNAEPSMSASPVMLRPAPAQDGGAMAASLEPAKPVTPAPAARPAPAVRPAAVAIATPKAPAAVSIAQPAAFKIAAANAAQQPQQEQAAGQAAKPAPPPPPVVQADAEAPSKYVDPGALQKPNRSGKGGKLNVSGGEAGAAPADAAALGYADQPR